MPTAKSHQTLQGQAMPGKMLALPLCLLLVCCAGCFTKKRPALHFSNVALAHPVVPSATMDAALEPAPDMAVELEVPPRLGAPRAAPVRPHVASAPVTEPAPVEKPAEPVIAPELSAGQLKAARVETQHSLDIAESNLARTQGKQLNPAEEDLASKVRGFMDSAREAMRNADWPRARTLAKKAEVLSEQLAGNL
jgi:hypothetical protein